MHNHVDNLSREQSHAFDQAHAFAENTTAGNTFFVAGQAGAGKTHLLTAISRHFPDASQLAPIGKAAANLATRTGRKAETIHSFLYHLEKVTKGERGRPEMKWRARYGDGAFPGRLVLLDEAAIAGVRVVGDLLATGCRIIAVGDPHQMKPVGEDPYFTEPDAVLTEPHRTALDSPIIRQAHRILAGQHYEPDGDKFRVTSMAYDQDVLSADVMLCFTHRQRVNLNARARTLRGIQSPSPQPGEPIVCRKNYRLGGVYKGAIYTLVEPFDTGDTQITINIDGTVRTLSDVKFAGVENEVDEAEANTFFDYGYAITVHSSAGSEWPNVLFFDNFPRSDPYYQRFVYTAVTRASERLTVVRGR